MNRIGLLKLFTSLVVITASLVGHAAQERGGGDEVGMEFQSAFINALKAIREKNPELQKTIRELKVTDALITANILVVETDLQVTIDSVTQSSVAVNYPKQNRIEVNRRRWQSIRDHRVKEGIALHEYLSLMRIERTGYYPISGKYLASMGLDNQVLISGDVKYPLAEELFANQPPHFLYCRMIETRGREVKSYKKCFDLRMDKTAEFETELGLYRFSFISTEHVEDSISIQFLTGESRFPWSGASGKVGSIVSFRSLMENKTSTTATCVASTCEK